MKIDHEKSSNPLQAYLPRIDSSLAFKDIAAGCGAEVSDHRRAKEVDPQIRCGGNPSIPTASLQEGMGKICSKAYRN